MKQIGFYITICFILGPSANERIEVSSPASTSHSNWRVLAKCSQYCRRLTLYPAHTSATAWHSASQTYHNPFCLPPLGNFLSPKGKNIDYDLTVWITFGVCCLFFLQITSTEAVVCSIFASDLLEWRFLWEMQTPRFSLAWFYIIALFDNLWSNKVFPHGPMKSTWLNK